MSTPLLSDNVNAATAGPVTRESPFEPLRLSPTVNVMTRFARLLLPVLAAATFQNAASGFGISLPNSTLTDGNSSLLVNPRLSTEMQDWLVDGLDQMFSQAFWLRIGRDGREIPLSNLPRISVLQSSPESLQVLYESRRLSVSLAYSLMGGDPGSGVSTVQEQIEVHNRTRRSMALHFYQYVDADLAGSPKGDTVKLNLDANGQFRGASQVDGDVAFIEQIAGPAASHAQVGNWPTLLGLLNDRRPTVLSDFSGPVEGDASFAFEWDPVLAAGSSFAVSLTKTVAPLGEIPEPATGALLSMAGLAFTAMRRRPS